MTVRTDVDIEIKVRFTAREAEILELLSKGMNRKEIARLLHMGTRTVQFHVSRLMFKLSATNSAEAVSNAFRLGVLE